MADLIHFLQVEGSCKKLERERERERERCTQVQVPHMKILWNLGVPKARAYREEVVPYLLHDVRGRLEDDGKGQCQLKRQKQSHDVIERTTRKILKYVTCPPCKKSQAQKFNMWKFSTEIHTYEYQDKEG